MERNAWKVAQDVVTRIDGEPGPVGDCMKAFVTNKKDNLFFFNTKYLKQYTASKSEVTREKVPGHHYFKKLDDEITRCMISGEMFHEYCKSVPPTPHPVPDISKLPKYHYLPVKETPISTNEGRRGVDDYHRRAHLNQVHKNKEISIKDSTSVQTFCSRYIVEESLVKNYLEHLNHLEMMSNKRKTEKKTKNAK